MKKSHLNGEFELIRLIDDNESYVTRIFTLPYIFSPIWIDYSKKSKQKKKEERNDFP